MSQTTTCCSMVLLVRLVGPNGPMGAQEDLQGSMGMFLDRQNFAYFYHTFDKWSLARNF